MLPMQNITTPVLIVEGVVFPVNPIEVLGFSSPLSDEVITTLINHIQSKSNSLQISLLGQLESEVRRSRKGEVESRNKAVALHHHVLTLKAELDAAQASDAETVNFDFKDINTFNETQMKLIKMTATWIRAKTLAEVEVNGLEHCIHQNEAVNNDDIFKSSMFDRIRGGMSPLVHIPPTAFGQPWYQILDKDNEFRVAIETPASLSHKLLDNDAEGIVGEKILINKCEWTINKVDVIGKEYQLIWPHFSCVYKLKRSNKLLNNRNGHEQGWTLQKMKI